MRANPNLPMIDLADLQLTSEELNRWKAIPEVAAEIRRQEAIDIVVGTTEALAEERGGDKVYGSMVKQALKRVRPGFAESYYGFRSFNAMLEAAAANGWIERERAIVESVTAIKRAGAGMILTYWATELAASLST